MAYVTGSAGNITQLQTALVNACLANGWSNGSGSTMYKGDCHIKIDADTGNDNLTCLVGLGNSGGAITTPAPAAVYHTNPLSSEDFVWPMTYHIHIGGDEVYLVTNWGIDKWLTLGFGQSPVAGMPGKGVWIAGTGFTSNDTGGTFVWTSAGSMAGDYSASINNNARTGLFLVNSGSGGTSAGCYVHHGITDWSGLAGAMPKAYLGSHQLTTLDNPSINPTGQTVLVPVQPWIDRGSSKVSIVADLIRARFIRIDNLNAGDIITLGSDQWKVYPVYKKNSTTREGGATHSGTYGYAIRYEV